MLIATLAFSPVWEPGQHPWQLDKQGTNDESTQVFWQHRQDWAEQTCLCNSTWVEMGGWLVHQSWTQVYFKDNDRLSPEAAMSCWVRIKYMCIYCSMLFDSDAGHTVFLDDTYECQGRIPAGTWGEASIPWANVVRIFIIVQLFPDKHGWHNSDSNCIMLPLYFRKEIPCHLEMRQSYQKAGSGSRIGTLMSTGLLMKKVIIRSKTSASESFRRSYHELFLFRLGILCWGQHWRLWPCGKELPHVSTSQMAETEEEGEVCQRQRTSCKCDS